MTILAVETSCDETSVAVVRDGTILANVVSSQIKLHAEYGGVVPELATRAHLRNFLPVARTALAVCMPSNKPLTSALSPSDGERECAFPPEERSLFSDAIHDRAKVLPLPFLQGEGRGEASLQWHTDG